jgi:hypothetical protein
VVLTGWNQDLISDDKDYRLKQYLGGRLPGTTLNFADYSLFEVGAVKDFFGSKGLPKDGKLTSQLGAKVSYQLQPASGNNVLVVAGASAKLSLAGPQSFHSLQFLHASDGPSDTKWNVTLSFTDGTATVVPMANSIDWRKLSPNTAVSNVMVAKAGQQSCTTNKNCSPPAVFPSEIRHLNEVEHKLSAGDRLKLLESVSVTQSEGGPLIVLAVSGTATRAVPSASSPQSTISRDELTKVLNWIQREYTIDQTPFCYKTAAYDRGVGVVPGCGSGEEKDGLLCYPKCRSGFSGDGPLCNPTETLSYTPKWECKKKVLGNCVWGEPGDCRSGYKKVSGVCWREAAPYGRGVGSALDECSSDRVLQAGLCYTKPRDGYSCNVTNCQQKCESGLTDCLGTSCARNANACGSNVANMVVSPAIMFVSIGSGTTAGVAFVGVKTAANAKKFADAAGNLQELEQLAQGLNSAIAGFMAAAELDLASISSTAIQQKVAAKYGLGSANYQTVARHWAHRQIAFQIQDLLKTVGTFIATTADTTGVLSTVDAFAKPTCAARSDIPN